MSDEEDRADEQKGGLHALGVEADPRDGAQSESYRTADPRTLVEEDGVVMSGPGGAPQDDSSIAERREASAAKREAAVDNPPPPER